MIPSSGENSERCNSGHAGGYNEKGDGRQRRVVVRTAVGDPSKSEREISRWDVASEAISVLSVVGIDRSVLFYTILRLGGIFDVSNGPNDRPNEPSSDCEKAVFEVPPLR